MQRQEEELEGLVGPLFIIGACELLLGTRPFTPLGQSLPSTLCFTSMFELIGVTFLCFLNGISFVLGVVLAVFVPLGFGATSLEN